MSKTDVDKPEDKLVRSLTAYLAGSRRFDNDAHLQYRGSKHYYDGLGSQNYDVIGMFLCLVLEIAGAIEELLGPERKYQREKFMGTEFNSGDPYGAMHFVPRGLTAKWAEEHGNAELLAAYREWLLFWACIHRLSQADDGTVLLAGMRTAPNDHGNTWAQYFLSCGGLGDPAAAEAALRRSGQAPQKRGKWKFYAGKILGPTLRRAWAPLLDGVPPEVAMPRTFHAAPEFNVRRSEGGLIVWCKICTNNNTGPIMGSAVYKGDPVVHCLPDFFTHNPDLSLVVTLDGGALHYGDKSLALPGGAELLRFRVPRAGEPWGDVPEDPDRPPIDPPPVDPPAEVDIESLVAEVIALGAQPDQTEPAVALVRAQRWAEASAAVGGMMVAKKRVPAQMVLSGRLANLAEDER